MADRYAIIISADYDDGDYVEESNEYSEEEYKEARARLDRILPVLEENDGRWENLDIGNSVEDYVKEGLLTEEDADWFDDIVPSAEHGIHTIESIYTYKFSEKERIY